MAGPSFEQMWRDLAPAGACGQRRLLPAAVRGGRARVRRLVRRGRRRAAASSVERDGNGNVVAWWGEPADRAGGGHRLAPRLGARRRGVRRPARRGVGAGRRRPCCATAGVDARRADRGRRCSSRRRARGSGCACLGSRLADRARSTPEHGARSCATATGVACSTRSSRRCRAATSDRRPAATGSAASSSCTSSRAATSSTATPPVGVAQRDLAARALPLRLHRRGQPRRHHARWRTAATRC